VPVTAGDGSPKIEAGHTNFTRTPGQRNWGKKNNAYLVNIRGYFHISIILFSTEQHINSTNKILGFIQNKLSLLPDKQH
jgi:hypothetical protein